MPMKARVVPATTVMWKWAGAISVLCSIRLTAGLPMITPLIPPSTPNMNRLTASAANPGSPHGAQRPLNRGRDAEGVNQAGDHGRVQEVARVDVLHPGI